MPPDEQRGRVRRLVPRGTRLGRRRDRQPRRLDALQLRDPRRPRALRRAGRRSPPLEHRPAGGVAPQVGDLRPDRETRDRQRTGRLSRSARISCGERMNARAQKLAEKLEEPLIVTTPANIRYLTGFVSSNASVVVEPERVRLFTDFRYAAVARTVPDVEFVETRRETIAHLAESLSGKFGFESTHLTYRAYEELRDGGLELVPRAGLVESLRAVKDEDELE